MFWFQELKASVGSTAKSLGHPGVNLHRPTLQTPRECEEKLGDDVVFVFHALRARLKPRERKAGSLLDRLAGGAQVAVQSKI